MDFVVDVEPRLGSGSPDGFSCKAGRLLCRLFCLRFVQPVPGGMQLFPGPVCLFLSLLEPFGFDVRVFLFLPAVCPAAAPGPSGSRPEGSPPPGASSCRIRSEGRGWSSSCRNFPPFGFGPCWPEVDPFPSGASSSSKRSRREGPEVSGPSRIFGSVWPEVFSGGFCFGFLLMVYTPFPGSRFLSSGRVVIMA